MSPAVRRRIRRAAFRAWLRAVELDEHRWARTGNFRRGRMRDWAAWVYVVMREPSQQELRTAATQFHRTLNERKQP